MLPNPPRVSFRASAIVFGLLVMGIAIFVHAWTGWSEGSVLIRPKNAVSYIAKPGSATAFSFYVYTIGLMVVGLVVLLAGIRSAWLISFSSSPRKNALIEVLNQPIRGRKSLSIPLWLFWGVILAFVCVYIYAAVKVV
jgi:heme/copper-type cytochrome/quinol oxidase subunit 2